jgi:L-ribulokinase
VAGICGQVDGSIMPEMIGLEAGQSAFGDIYAWFKDLLSWPLDAALPKTVSAKVRREAEERIIPLLSAQAEEIDPAQSTLIALDWLNGRRTPFADQALKGAIAGLTLGSSAPRIFRALVEATAFGSRAIVEQFRKEGISVSEVIALGGIARKNDFVMQVTADVLDMPIKVAAADQAVALGAAMFGAVAGGVFPAISDAQKAMGRGFDKTYAPNKKHAIFYGKRYEDYVSLGTKLEGLLRKL